jgi:hypothetical protein
MELLIKAGSKTNALDNQGWPPILYADWGSIDTIVFLIGADPSQLLSLGRLFSEAESKKIVKNIVVKLATVPVFYGIFNQFLREHSSVLHDSKLSFLFEEIDWKLVDFKNKRTYFLSKLSEEATYASYIYSETLVISRSSLFEDAKQQIMKATFDFRKSLKVEFKNEPGVSYFLFSFFVCGADCAY